MEEEGSEDSAAEGFCHFNEGADAVEFSLELFGHPITIAQRPVLSSLGHGACVWDASIIFAKYVEVSRDFAASAVRGRSVLELGSGCGLAGISLMLRGAAVTLTDLEAVTSQLTRPNAMRIYHQFIGRGNVGGVQLIRPSVTSVDWTQHAAPCDEASLHSPYDLVLLTDCVFSRALVCDLVATIRKYSGLKSEVVCCHEVRDEDANTAFISELSKFFKLKRVTRDKLHPYFNSDQVIIVRGKPLRR